MYYKFVLSSHNSRGKSDLLSRSLDIKERDNL